MIFKCDTYMQRKAPQEVTDPSEMIVPITSDRGLCGGINSGVIREIKSELKDRDVSNVHFFILGEKGNAALKRPFPTQMVTALTDLQYPLNYPMVMAIAGKIAS